MYPASLLIRAKFGVLEHTQGLHLRAKFRLDRFIPSPSGSEKPKFCHFFGIRHIVVSAVGSNLRKLNRGAVHNYKPYPVQRY